jgi:hypothetical protein
LPTRRQFLQVGAAGAALLVAARLLDRPAPTLPSYRVLDGGSASIIAALVPVVLAGALPAASPQRETAAREVVEAFDRAISGLSPAVRGEIDDLLGVLRFGPTRWLLTGIASPLGEASAADVAAFLSRWRASRFDLMRAGYQALTQLIAAAWYDNPLSWPAIGYPGPPALR